MNKQELLEKLEDLQNKKRKEVFYKNFWITKSPIGGFTVVKHAYFSSSMSCEHFSNAQRVIDFLKINA